MCLVRMNKTKRLAFSLSPNKCLWRILIELIPELLSQLPSILRAKRTPCEGWSACLTIGRSGFDSGPHRHHTLWHSVQGFAVNWGLKNADWKSSWCRPNSESHKFFTFRITSLRRWICSLTKRKPSARNERLVQQSNLAIVPFWFGGIETWLKVICRKKPKR